MSVYVYVCIHTESTSVSYPVFAVINHDPEMLAHNLSSPL